MALAKVYVNYKKSILNPEAEAVHKALKRLGYDNVEDVKLGKYFELTVADGKSKDELDKEINEICDKLLANYNMENYHYEIEETEAAQ
ncbi:phosphoribosylformylglycinamidine synthase subunit PurS [Lentilactobacillus kefiri]|jgi:phosphoribosylformylglycinamidine synthase PurS subunit|uniref:Phosphoribosylformylglycinamidine synthase subunit PurS n=2 Tax=Lentilactobacillus kefiri TaxID=33962 RepID=A0A8E1RJY5_LENKE|nr:phosphoribosylformylglycinamidine synthase subunit PurS [Lentilactobacillus kefiri]KRL72702.1 phosphoribosylformylglycinamidine synthase PurS [Lentilactobacillus parakefiri DSM 10551]KRM52689.1 phosphoribosylformylglycinamidine synthase PurS [Lentilactobacillus kefiri DSM 20587 = JCM 5818]MCJ2161399.1 phosphoribosylformylglycinamidine synthase subunit PurS [Lentilactobacillus kefiri]MCP9368675.1 phosphoribosylformylglycinamidine synthase subunit PurS [Lentilactobacillus kefiri]MDH5107968.1 